MANQTPGLLGGEVDSGCVEGVGALPPMILNITAPQTGHLPFTALRPFFMVSSMASAMGCFALHRTQYPSAIQSDEAGKNSPAFVSFRSLSVGRWECQPMAPFILGTLECSGFFGVRANRRGSNALIRRVPEASKGAR